MQVELIQYRKQMLTLFHVNFCEAMDSMQLRPPNANQEVSNTTHFLIVYADSRSRVNAWLVDTKMCYEVSNVDKYLLIK